MSQNSTRLVKRMHRFFLIFAVMILLIGIPILIGDLIVVLSTRSLVLKQEEAEKADCILVLGCGLTSAGEPGQHLRLRMDKAIQLYKQGAAPKILVSGDHGREDYDEVNAMKRYAVQQGVPAEDIFMDHAGFSTYESMVRAAEMFECKSVIVVTQPFHIYRAIYDGRAQGMRVTGVSADNAVGYSRRYTLYLQLREILARCKDVLWCLCHVDVPTVSQPIPITGSGAATDDAHTALWMSEMDQ